ncbi:hypothetical protein PSACC_02926 [Paramicrosporidium saccamoebae]|uniref:Sorting nexin-3 n=1 Tax=Paramicrosporidium saccamoebae TaxID=1246581 RepID=A0A2H9THK7_9FUNG|nr:hypothetical protein PSACC_02926 [Paramicrosporidium saccamoebae]
MNTTSENEASVVEDLYACPENIMTVHVSNPITHRGESDPYTDYEIYCKVFGYYACFLTSQTSLPLFKKHESSVRRRYCEFLQLREVLIAENPGVRIPDLPSRRIFGNRFSDAVIEERRVGFQKFLQT